MSYFVRRENPETGRIGFTGPIRTARQAGKEAAAWASSGWYPVRVLESTPALRAEVRQWEKDSKARRQAGIDSITFV